MDWGWEAMQCVVLAIAGWAAIRDSESIKRRLENLEGLLMERGMDREMEAEDEDDS